MSLEQKIEELTKAVEGLTAVMKGGVTATVAAPTDAEPAGEKRGRKPKNADAPSAAAAPTASAAPAAADPFADEPDPFADAAPTKTYTLDDVRAAILKARSEKGDAAALGILNTIGVKTLGNIEAKDFARVIEEVKKLGVAV